MATAFSLSPQSPEPYDDVDAFLAATRRKSLLRLLTCGSVDDGKSTLLGRLLYDSKALLEDQIETLEADSRRSGTQGEALDFALLVDGLAAEREQGITIDVAYRYFATDKRKFIVADTPGHEQYTRNMVTGASTADLAIILVDATRGVLRQTRRHSTLVHLLGIRNVVLAVNKMDLVGNDEGRFDEIVADYRAFAERIGIAKFSPIPITAIFGDNIARRSQAMPWYSGELLLDHLENVPARPKDHARRALQFPVQWVNRPNSDFRGYAGRLVGGSVRRGDAIKVLPSGRRSRVERIVTFDGDIDQAIEGQSVTLTLADELDCSRGEVIVTEPSPLKVVSRIGANLVWMAEESFAAGTSYWLQLGTATISATVERIDHLIDVDSGHSTPARPLGLNDIGHVVVRLDREVPASTYADGRKLGGFILIDKMSRDTVAAGMIDVLFERGASDEKPEADRIYWVDSAPMAEQARRHLQQMGRLAFILDEGVLGDLSDPDPEVRVHRARAAAILLSQAGVTVVISVGVAPSEYWPGRAFDLDQLNDQGADEWVI